MVEQAADPGIYINDQPTPDDVQQGGIGDCYFQAALLGMAGRDPGRIKSMIAADGAGGATITLWRRQDHRRSLLERIFGSNETYDYTPVQVAVSDQLAVNISDGTVHGAQLRCAPQPGSVDYWAEINGNALEVHRKDLYQCARWAPLMEKAYARFCEQHGQYGGAAPAGQSGSPAGTPGYDGINSGVASYALHVLYGAQSDAPGALQYEWMTAFPAAGSNILAANPRVVDQLLMLAGRSDRAQPSDTTSPIITANTSPDSQIQNLGTAVTNALADPDYASLSADTKTKITALQTAVTTWQGLPPDPAGTPGPKAAAQTAVGNAAVEVARTPNHDDLAELRRHNPSPIQFDGGSDAVRAADVPRLDFLGQWLQYVSVASLCPFIVNVTGHSSTDGSDVENEALSLRRATNTNTAIHAGRDASKMARHTYNITGVGETGATATADWRRADITIEHDRPDNELFAGARSAPMRAMMDLVLNVRNLGTDNSVGQRNVYAAHAYNVVSVNFVTTAGAPVLLHTAPAASRAAMYPQVDCDVSTIGLRNPHHGNEPDRTGMNQPTRPGDGAPSGPTSDGAFTMSVNEFFRNFNTLDTGVFPTTPNP
jgi:outer membrane protein OmpA-like peptidoglycan-associated protein